MTWMWRNTFPFGTMTKRGWFFLGLNALLESKSCMAMTYQESFVVTHTPLIDMNVKRTEPSKQHKILSWSDDTEPKPTLSSLFLYHVLYHVRYMISMEERLININCYVMLCYSISMDKVIFQQMCSNKRSRLILASLSTISSPLTY